MKNLRSQLVLIPYHLAVVEALGVPFQPEPAFCRQSFRPGRPATNPRCRAGTPPASARGVLPAGWSVHPPAAGREAFRHRSSPAHCAAAVYHCPQRGVFLLELPAHRWESPPSSTCGTSRQQSSSRASSSSGPASPQPEYSTAVPSGRATHSCSRAQSHGLAEGQGFS